jgi:hypothetical protein
MIVTEQEASEKSCPYFDKKCEGSRCMAWEWHYQRHGCSNPKGLEPVPTRTNSGSCSRS